MSPNRTQYLAADFGNFELKFCHGSDKPQAIRSVHYRLPQGISGLTSKPNSPLVELPDGTRYHFGTQAFKYNSFEKTVVSDKAQLAKLHLYACLQHSGNIGLIVSHHSPDEYRATLTQALMGKHSFKRNGVEIAANVQSVEVVAEGQGSYWLANEAGYIPQSGYTIVIDIGGGSWLSTIYDADGDAIAHQPVDRFGVWHLALQVANDERLKAPLRQYGITAADPTVVMDGFANGHYYQETGIRWADWLPEYLDAWFRNIFSTVKAQYAIHLPNTRRFIVTGGGAHLIAERVQKNPAFVVMPDPNFANVLGMANHFNPAQTLAAIA